MSVSPIYFILPLFLVYLTFLFVSTLSLPCLTSADPCLSAYCLLCLCIHLACFVSSSHLLHLCLACLPISAPLTPLLIWSSVFLAVLLVHLCCSMFLTPIVPLPPNPSVLGYSLPPLHPSCSAFIPSSPCYWGVPVLKRVACASVSPQFFLATACLRGSHIVDVFRCY